MVRICTRPHPIIHRDTRNATFRNDNSVLCTGEDFALPPGIVLLTTSPMASAIPITESSIESAEQRIGNSTGKDGLVCDEMADPHVLISVEKFNLRTFKCIVFFEYQTPVAGSTPDECDVDWRFRNKKEKSWRKYQDFGGLDLASTDNDDCMYQVVHADGWHSGINARRPSSRSSGPKGSEANILPFVQDEEINDTIPCLGSEANFGKGRYLYYSRGGDYCKGMNHYMWSFLYALGEAMYLNRTFVMDLSMCLLATYNPRNRVEEDKDFRYYFDFEHLKEVASLVDEGEFVRDWKKWDKTHKRKVPVRKIVTYRDTPMQLKKDKSTILWRQFDAPEQENYWYRVCEGQAAKYIQRMWHALWKSKRLMNIVSEISGKIDWDLDAVHVVHGEKAQNKGLWPNLDVNTSPDALLLKLKGMIQPSRNLYVARNEPFNNYFDKLRSQSKVHLLEDYKELWGNRRSGTTRRWC